MNDKRSIFSTTASNNKGPPPVQDIYGYQHKDEEVKDNMFKLQMATCKDLIQEMNKQSDVEFYDILLYKAMQPYPLRGDMNRIRIEGEYAKNAPDMKKNLIKQLKYNSFTTYMERMGTEVPKIETKVIQDHLNNEETNRHFRNQKDKQKNKIHHKQKLDKLNRASSLLDNYSSQVKDLKQATYSSTVSVKQPLTKNPSKKQFFDRRVLTHQRNPTNTASKEFILEQDSGQFQIPDTQSQSRTAHYANNLQPNTLNTYSI